MSYLAYDNTIVIVLASFPIVQIGNQKIVLNVQSILMTCYEFSLTKSGHPRLRVIQQIRMSVFTIVSV